MFDLAKNKWVYNFYEDTLDIVLKSSWWTAILQYKE